VEDKAPAPKTISRLKAAYPDARTELNWTNPLELLVATMLSAQTTDVRVNTVTPNLFAKYPTAAAYARADPAELEGVIRPTGFFRNKAKSLRGMARALVDDHGGEVPRTMPDLVALPGVGRKTANVVLGNAFSIDEGIVVDTHVRRLSNRLGFTTHEDPDKIERDLTQAVPREEWTIFSHLLILHGRNICRSRKPDCENCILNDLCPSAFRV
jgi:endonuclease-3